MYIISSVDWLYDILITYSPYFVTSEFVQECASRLPQLTRDTDRITVRHWLESVDSSKPNELEFLQSLLAALG